MRENDELLPGRVGLVIVSGNGMEAQRGFEFADGFLFSVCEEINPRRHDFRSGRKDREKAWTAHPSTRDWDGQ